MVMKPHGRRGNFQRSALVLLRRAIYANKTANIYVQFGYEGMKIISQNQDKHLLWDNGIVLILVYMINMIDRPLKCETDFCI